MGPYVYLLLLMRLYGSLCVLMHPYASLLVVMGPLRYLSVLMDYPLRLCTYRAIAPTTDSSTCLLLIAFLYFNTY